MSGEERKRDDFGALQGCFVDGDAELRARQRKIRRRALVLSVAAQSILSAAVIIVPLFAKPERIALASDVFLPLPPYVHVAPERRAVAHEQRQQPTHKPCWLCPPIHMPTAIVTHTEPTPEPPGSDSLDNNSVINLGPALLPGTDSRQGPRPPEVKPHVERPTIVHVTHLDPAMLIRRIDPIYPPLARQTRKEGRVELHAIISTDGTVQSLQVISGDVLFHKSALDAVAQWRYRPTVLNGTPVQVDTTITVIYTLAQ